MVYFLKTKFKIFEMRYPAWLYSVALRSSRLQSKDFSAGRRMPPQELLVREPQKYPSSDTDCCNSSLLSTLTTY